MRVPPDGVAGVRLTDLEIRDLGIIRDTALQLEAGLNVLTGETGAGKTMVVTGLEWLLGGRTDRERVRQGAGSAVVQACFEGVPATAGDWVGAEDQDLIVLREVAAKDAPASRSRARLGGRLAPVSALTEVMAPVVEVHSQHESIRMGQERVQRALLDRFGGEAVAVARTAYRVAYTAWRDAEEAVEAARSAVREGRREADRLRMELAEIDAVDPADGEETALDADLSRLEHAEGLRRAADAAMVALTGDGGARDCLGEAIAEIRHEVAHDAALADPLARLESQLAEVQEVAIDLRAYLEDVDADPEALQNALARRAAIGRLLRKYGATSSEVRAYAADARARLTLIDGGEAALEGLLAQATAARAAVERTGAALRDARGRAATALATAIDGHLRDLAMPDARTDIVVSPAEPGHDGADTIDMRLAANPGMPALPLGRAASGGERSRVALAVKVALADVDDVPVMVFDEVDAGIGGETALQVGRKLAQLARAGRQVICVTHLPQLAAFADAHFVVSKHTGEATTTTSVRRLGDDDRLVELSRMLSGTPDSAAARANAAQLLDLAAADATTQ